MSDPWCCWERPADPSGRRVSLVLPALFVVCLAVWAFVGWGVWQVMA